LVDYSRWKERRCRRSCCSCYKSHDENFKLL